MLCFFVLFHVFSCIFTNILNRWKGPEPQHGFRYDNNNIKSPSHDHDIKIFHVFGTKGSTAKKCREFYTGLAHNYSRENKGSIATKVSRSRAGRGRGRGRGKGRGRGRTTSKRSRKRKGSKSQEEEKEHSDDTMDVSMFHDNNNKNKNKNKQDLLYDDRDRYSFESDQPSLIKASKPKKNKNKNRNKNKNTSRRSGISKIPASDEEYTPSEHLSQSPAPQYHRMAHNTPLPTTPPLKSRSSRSNRSTITTTPQYAEDDDQQAMVNSWIIRYNKFNEDLGTGITFPDVFVQGKDDLPHVPWEGCHINSDWIPRQITDVSPQYSITEFGKVCLKEKSKACFATDKEIDGEFWNFVKSKCDKMLADKIINTRWNQFILRYRKSPYVGIQCIERSGEIKV